jgi:hypothetical protein
MASISAGDIIEIVQFLGTTIMACINASKAKRELRDVLQELKDITSLMRENINQYVLYPDQVKAWYLSLRKLERLVSKVGKSLAPAAPGNEVFESMKFGMWTKFGLESKIAELESRRDKLRKLKKEYVPSLPQHFLLVSHKNFRAIRV